jgi:hypothetical protein
MLVESLIAMGGAKLGEHLLKNATDVGQGAIKDYLQGFFKGKLGDVVDKFKLELKAAMEKAIGEFMKLFVEELRYSGVPDKSIERYYLLSIESFIKDKETISILGKAFDAGFKGFDDIQISQIKDIWIVYLKSGLTFPLEFDWQLLLNNYEIKVKEIRRADEKLRKILDSETLQSIDDGIKNIHPTLQSIDDVAKKTYEIQKSNAPIPIEFNLDGYRESLRCSYGYLKLTRLDSKGKHNIQLGKIFIEQNVREDLPPDRSPNPDSDESRQNRRQYLEKSPEPVLKAIRDENCQCAVLLGDPGSGKSSLLQYLALDWAEGKTERFPLLIELREYAFDRSGAKNFLDFLSEGARADWKFDRQELHAYLLHQPSLVMFDGLDEIFDPQVRESVVDEIANFATQQYPNAKIVVTSRVVGYDPDRLRGVKFQHFTLQELDESQIQEFIDKWYELALGKDPQQEQLKRRLKDAIEHSPSIRMLANNPLLLTLMATLNQQGSLPNRRVDLYDRASRLLLHNWDFEGKKLADPSLQAIEVPEKQEILGKVAYEMQSEAGIAGNLLRSQRLKQILTGYLKENDFPASKEKAHRLIEQLRTRSFVLCAYGTDAYGFIHLTFLEYFCARDFVRRLKEEQYSCEQLRDDVFARYWRDETWHEVLKLICGLLEPEQAGYLVEFLMMQEVDRADYLDDKKRATTGAVQHLLLATECWAEVENPKWGLIAQKLKEKLKQEIESQSNILLKDDTGKLLLESIGKYYHKEPETLTWLQQVAFNYQNVWVRLAAVESIAEYYHTEPGTLNWLKDIAFNAQHEFVRWAAVLSGYVRQAAVESIAKYYHTEPGTLNWLKDIALNAQHEDVGWSKVKDYIQHLYVVTAVWSIAEYYYTEPGTLNCLKDIALNAQHKNVRQTAVWSIANDYHTEPGTLNCLKDIALNAQHEDVGGAAVRSIVQYYHTEPGTLNCLKDIALNAQHEDVGGAAVRSIAKDYHTEPGTLNCLKDIALNAQHEDVGGAAVRSIAKDYHTEPGTLNCLKDIALNAQHEDVGGAAVKSIAKDYHTEPGTLNCLKDIALNAQHGDVRAEAVLSIAKYYHTEPGTLNWLKDIALNAQHEDVRAEAVLSISEYYHTEPGTLNWLKDIAFNAQHEFVRREAVLSIAEYYHTEPATLNWLKDIAFNDQHEDVRAEAVLSIAKYYHTEPATLNWLKDIAFNDQHEDVRWEAVLSISKYYHTEPGTLNCLKDIALNAQHENVRRTALKSIAQYHIQDDIAFKLLCQIASQDPYRGENDRNPRKIALEAVVKNYIDRPEVIELLRDRSTQDPDEELRIWAEEQLNKL